MTVYVVQEVPGINILPANKFGELELLLPPRSQELHRKGLSITNW